MATITVPQTVTMTAGLLGAEVDHDMMVTLGGSYIVNCRLEEIERRILALEARGLDHPTMSGR